VQCISTVTCDCTFNVPKSIKTQVRNILGSKNLEAMLQIALEDLYEEVDDIISDAIPIWKNDTKYQFLFANPSSYLNSPNGPTVSNASCW